MRKFWKRMKTPRGMVLAALALMVLLGVTAVAIAAPMEALATIGLLGLPAVGVLTADRETQYKEWPGIKSYPVLTGVTIYKGGFVCIDPATGYARPGADTATYRCVGVAEEQVVAGAAASGTYRVRVRTGMFLMAATSITQLMVGAQMYVRDDQTFDDTSTNGIAAGILVEYVTTTSGWILCGPSALPIASITATAGELNKTAGIPSTSYLVVCAERHFVETAVAGTYTATVTIPAGSSILDVQWSNQAVWNNTTSATLNVGDTEDANGYFIAVDLKAAPVADVNGAGGISNAGQDAGTGAYAGLVKYSAAGTIVTATVVTVHAVGDTGRSRLRVIYATPTSVIATKV